MGFLDGKVSVVTGAGQGLGRACAMLFAREGAKVVVADINEQSGSDCVSGIAALGGHAEFVRVDVSSEADVEAMVQFALDRFGGLDFAINNAMRAQAREPLAEIDLAAWERTIAVNFTGVFLCMKYQIKAMLSRGGGSIVNIGSGRENSAKSGLSWYLAAKQGVYGMTRCAALDYAERGIRVNAVAPGPMWTPALREQASQTPGHIESHVAHVPLRRIAEPEEVAEGVIWLCSPGAGYVTGVTLSVDGGYTLL